ncbi:MAG TPA: hypothetical protein ENK08_06155 [Chloroflexi bacterium]|nr:hypothetical protein [Chloroflexota bacterium]
MNRRTLIVLLGAFLVLTVSFLSACGKAAEPTTALPSEQPAQGQPTQPPRSTSPAVEATPAPPTEQPALIEGETLVQERCTVCHGLSRIQQASKTEDEWRRTVARMVGKGADLNEAEQAIVIQYLTETYGR